MSDIINDVSSFVFCVLYYQLLSFLFFYILGRLARIDYDPSEWGNFRGYIAGAIAFFISFGIVSFSLVVPNYGDFDRIIEFWLRSVVPPPLQPNCFTRSGICLDQYIDHEKVHFLFVDNVNIFKWMSNVFLLSLFAMPSAYVTYRVTTAGAEKGLSKQDLRRILAVRNQVAGKEKLKRAVSMRFASSISLRQAFTLIRDLKATDLDVQMRQAGPAKIDFTIHNPNGEFKPRLYGTIQKWNDSETKVEIKHDDFYKEEDINTLKQAMLEAFNSAGDVEELS